MNKELVLPALHRLPFEYLRLQAFVLLLQAFGVLHREGVSTLIVFAVMLCLACVFAYLQVALMPAKPHSSENVSNFREARSSPMQRSAPSLAWHAGFIVLASASLWLVLYVAERFSIERFGEASFPVSNAIGVLVIVLLALCVSISMTLARKYQWSETRHTR